MCKACEPGLAQLASWLTKDAVFDKQNDTASSAEPAATDDPRTTLFLNGAILTLADGELSPVDALVIRDEKVIYTGTVDGAKEIAGATATTFDLQGRSLLPGFIEPHVHISTTALADHFFLALPATKVTTVEAALREIKAAVEKVLSEDEWVAGYGYDPSRIEGHSDLSKKILDDVSTTTPIFILNQSGHIAYVNQEALDRAGVTPENAGHDFQRDADGNLTGVLLELAVAKVGAKLKSPGGVDMIKYCSLTLQKWISKGLTTVFDAGIGTLGANDFQLLKALPKSPVRIYAALATQAVPAHPSEEIKPHSKLGQVEVIAVKYWADGSTQGFTAALTEAYPEPPPGFKSHGVKNYPDSKALQEAISPWVGAGFQIVIHANGDAASDLALDAYENAFAEHPQRDTSIVHRIEHFTVTRPDQLTRAQRLGIGVSHTIGHVHFWGETFADYVLRDERAARIHPIASDVKAGLVFSFHSDSPITEANPLLHLKIATTRLTYQNGRVLGPDERVDLKTALRGVTLNPAIQIGIADKVGSIEVGKFADLIVLDKDLRAVALEDLDKLKVEQTWISGKVAWSQKEE